jgi:hypothetical protein
MPGVLANVPRSPGTARADVLKACDVKLGDRLIRFARSHFGPDWLQEVLGEAGLLDEEGMVPDAEMSLVIPWLTHCRRNARGESLADVWRRRQQPRLTSDEVLLLEAYERAWVSVWEVREVQPGLGSRVHDLLTREERFIHDVSSSLAMQRLDAVLAIVLTFDGLSFFGGINAQPLPPRFADAVAREARRLCRVRTRPVAPAKLRAPDLQLRLMALWAAVTDELLQQPVPVLQNTDGDPLVLTSDDFELLAPRAVVAERLATLEGTQPEQEGDEAVFVVTKAGNEMHRSWDSTVVGRIVLSGKRLTVETNSTRRADALRTAVGTHLNDLARFRLRKEENTAQLTESIRESGTRPAEQPGEPIPPEALAAFREFREEHLRSWMDDSIPALGGLTPRQAAAVPKARHALDILLKEMEQMEATMPPEQRIDVGWVREALGVGPSVTSSGRPSSRRPGTP